MPNPRLAARYAKSLIDLAQENGQLDQVFGDLLLLASVSRENRSFVTFIRNPVINADKKKKIFGAIFSGKLTNLTGQFCELLIRKGREQYLPDIAQAGVDQYRKINHIRRVKITTAVALDDQLKEAIVAKVKSEIPDEKIELETAVNADLVGGFVLESDNNLFDASIRRDLNDVKKQFSQNVYVANIR
jgi:F-type H+-transporting ATPase subunit delta